MILKQNSGSINKEWEQPKVGSYKAVCVDIIDKGFVETEYKGEKKSQHKVRLVWQLDAETSAGEPMLAGRTVTLSMGKNAKLREILTSWRGRDFTAQEMSAGFDLERVIGAQAQVIINEFKTEEGETRSFVDNVLRPEEGQSIEPNPAYKRMKDRESWIEPGQEVAVADDVEVPF